MAFDREFFGLFNEPKISLLALKLGKLWLVKVIRRQLDRRQLGRTD
jgi:hypothetical protein